jgi:transposase
VARKYGVNANLLFGWRRLHKRGLLEQCREPASLLPVTVTTPTVLPDCNSRPTRAVQAVKRPAVPAIGPCHIEIELPGDVRVRVHGRVEVDALSAVLAALRNR